MQIHELNDFAGTLGSGAYLAIDNGTDTGKISSEGLLAATEARIDNIIAGPAPSAEEIVDARLGADGVTYPTLGDAIRDQFTDVKSEIKSLADSQELIFFNETVSGTAMVEVPLSLEAGTYNIHVDNLISSDTDTSYSNIIFYNESTLLETVNFYRTPDALKDMSVTLNTPCTKAYFYASSNWSTSQGDTFTFENCLISQDTHLNERISENEKFIGEVSDRVDSILIPFSITETAGYYNSDGTIASASASNKEKYTNRLSVNEGDLVFWEFDTELTSFSDYLWIAYMAYDANQNVVGSRNQVGYEVTNKLNGVITIPDGVAYISFCYRTYGIDGFSASKYFLPIKGKEKSIMPYTFPFLYDKFYGHLFTHYIDWGSRDVEIPCQSIFDVQASARLGFKYIEANVHKTATSGKYVVTHGISGKLGQDFENADGTEIVGDVTIASTSYSDLRNNYRYRSKYAKYRVPITSLEEFLYECRSCNIYPLLQYVDATELEIATNIVGNNLILYAGNRQVFDGFIMEYASYSTEAEILARCSAVGSPYMYCMGNPTSFTDAQLKSIIAKVHQMGCYIGNAGNYDGLVQNIRLMNLGFDFSASGAMVNNFDNGNIINICNNPTFDGVTHTGTVSNGQLNLLENQKIEFKSDDSSYLKKFILDITYDGEFTISYPTYVDGDEISYLTISSDGSQSQRISGTLLNKLLSITLWANVGGVTVKDISFKMSKC